MSQPAQPKQPSNSSLISNTSGPFHVFFPHTTGLRKPKKFKPFSSYELALEGGKAANILNGTPDRFFIILPESLLECHTNITEPIPFSSSFYRYNRLSDTREKFGKKNTLLLDKELIEALPELQKGLISPDMESEVLRNQIVSETRDILVKWKGRTFYEILSGLGLSPSNILSVQNYIQHSLGITPFPATVDADGTRIIHALGELFSGDWTAANKYISSLAMAGLKNFGTTEVCKLVYPATEGDSSQ